MAEIIAKISTLTADEALEFVEQCESSPILIQNFVSNEFAPHDGLWIDSFNPKTGKIFARVPSSSEKDVENAVISASKAFPSWSKTTKSHRAKILNKIADLIAEKRDLFAIWESIDQGKTLARAKIEIDRAESNFR